MKPKILCTECSSEINPGDKFCPSCGVLIEWGSVDAEPVPEPNIGRTPAQMQSEISCDVCGHVNPGTARFCESCGARFEGAGSDPGEPKAARTQPNPPRSVKKGRKQVAKPVSSGRILSVAAAVILIGFAFYIFVVDRDSDHTHIHTEAPGMGGAGMQASIMQEIERLEHELEHHDADNQDAILRLANLYHDMNQYQNALRYYHRYIENNPDNPDVRVDLGICYFESGQPEQAVATVEQVVRDFPNHQLAAFNLGIIYLNLGDVEPANRYFRRAYEINPDNQTGQRAQRIIEEHTF
jgi:cytochrome c-type biogenesis protein CcmH/NrfG